MASAVNIKWIFYVLSLLFLMYFNVIMLMLLKNSGSIILVFTIMCLAIAGVISRFTAASRYYCSV